MKHSIRKSAGIFGAYVSKAKDRYEAELDKLEKLMRKRDELRSKELMEAFTNSERSFEEVMRFLSGNEVDDE